MVSTVNESIYAEAIIPRTAVLQVYQSCNSHSGGEHRLRLRNENLPEMTPEDAKFPAACILLALPKEAFPRY